MISTMKNSRCNRGNDWTTAPTRVPTLPLAGGANQDSQRTPSKPRAFDVASAALSQNIEGSGASHPQLFNADKSAGIRGRKSRSADCLMEVGERGYQCISTVIRYLAPPCITGAGTVNAAHDRIGYKKSQSSTPNINNNQPPAQSNRIIRFHSCVPSRICPRKRFANSLRINQKCNC